MPPLGLFMQLGYIYSSIFPHWGSLILTVHIIENASGSN